MTEFTTIQRTRRCLQSSALLLLVCLPMLAGCAVGSDTWYTRISDSDRADHDTGGLPFDFSGAGGMDNSYTVPVWNDEGDKTELTFGSDEPIPDDTWVQIETQAVRGVVSWKPVNEQDVPEKPREEALKEAGS